jgi:hypothetical protein
MEAIFSIRDAFAVFTTADYRKYMEQICVSLNKDMESSLKDYIEQVANDPVQWFHVFPDQLKSEAAFRKPYSAMTKLLGDPVVASHLGENFCKSSSKKIRTCWKNNFKAILDQRYGYGGQAGRAGSAYGEDDRSVNQENQTLDPDAGQDLEMQDSSSEHGSSLNIPNMPVAQTDAETEAMDNGMAVLKAKVKELNARIALTVKETNSLKEELKQLRENNEELKEILTCYVTQVHENDELTKKTIMKLVNHL